MRIPRFIKTPEFIAAVLVLVVAALMTWAMWRLV